MSNSPKLEVASWVAGILSLIIAGAAFYVEHPFGKSKDQEEQKTIKSAPALLKQEKVQNSVATLKHYKDSYFSFSYPPDWTQEKEGNVVIVRSPPGSGRQITLDFAPQPPSHTAEALLNTYEERYRTVAETLGKEISFLHEDTMFGQHVGKSTLGVFKNNGDTPSVVQTTLVQIGSCGYVAGGITANVSEGSVAMTTFRQIMNEIIDGAKAACP